MPCRFASSGTVATSRSASRAILALNAASNFLRDLVISVLHRLRQSRTLHTLTFGPISGVHFRQHRLVRNANNGLGHQSKFYLYSITSSARLSIVGEISMPRVLAALRLMTSWYRVGVCTGRSAGLSPLSMRSTYEAAWW